MATVQGLAALERRLKAIGDTKAALRALQIATISEAQKRAPRKTGHLQRSIRPGRVTDDFAIVEAKTPYAAAVEFGTKPHVIRPKNRKALAWAGPGGTRLSGRRRTNSGRLTFAAKVNHPGTRKQPYLIPGAKAAVSKSGGMKDTIVAKWNNAA